MSGSPGEATIAMLPLEWQSEYESGHGLIDMQHRLLFKSVNALIDAARSGAAKSAIALLDELISHTMEHFRDEEEVLARKGFADLEEHKRSHLRLVERTLMLRDGLIHGTASLGELLLFLADDVVASHMLCADRLYFGSVSH